MPSNNGHSQNFATAVSEVSERVSVLVREEIELAKVEVTQKVVSLAKGAAATFYSGVERSDLARLERTLQLKMRRGNVDADLAREERAAPVDVSSFVPVPVKPGSRMVCLPGEVLQRYSS